jgi:hypothetical protein
MPFNFLLNHNLIIFATVMKKTVLALCVLSFLSCSQEKNNDLSTDSITNSASATGKQKADLPDIKFGEEVFDFGRITQGEKVSHAFTFTNTGKGNLIISGASGSCGCTVPAWPGEPILPGKSGEINVVFNSEGKRGTQEKTVTVLTNCEPATRVIRIKAEIVVAETAQ